MITALVLALLAPPHPTAVSGHAGAELNGKIFVVGGTGKPPKSGFFDTLWEVDPEAGSWSAHPPIKVARAMAAGACLDGGIYIVGGFNRDGETLATAERFDIKKNQWSDVARLNIARDRFCMLAAGSKLYALGGIKGHRQPGEPLNTPTVEEYDPAKNRWRVAGSLNHGRHGFAATLWKGRIFVFGGNDNETERSAECWDPNTGQSVDLPAMPIPRGFGGAITLGDRIVCFGGRQAFGKSNPSALDPARGAWTQLSVPDTDLNRFVQGVEHGRLWLVGGESTARETPVLHSIDLAGLVGR